MLSLLKRYPLALFLTIIAAASFATASDSCSSKSKNDPVFAVLLSQTKWNVRKVQSWSGGGGKRVTVPSDSFWPFPGRDIGGGDRKTIYGTKIFGSGYPYGAPDNATVAGRPFPYGVWPLHWGENNFRGSEEYGPSLDLLRPGGPVVVAPLTKADETYYMMGDRDSVMALIVSMTTWCQATAALPKLFDANSTQPAIRPENVIQYYRASSFALIDPRYNNTVALSSTDPNAESVPFPTAIEVSLFRVCIDKVIATAIPIMDAPPKPPMSGGAIAGMVIGIVLGTVLVTMFPFFVEQYRRFTVRRTQRKTAKEAALARSKAQNLELEQYP